MCAPPTMRTIFHTQQPPYPRPRTNERRTAFSSRHVPDSPCCSRVPRWVHNLRSCGARARTTPLRPPPKYGGPGECIFSMGCSIGLGFGGVHTRHALHKHILHACAKYRASHARHHTQHNPHTTCKHIRWLTDIHDSIGDWDAAGWSFGGPAAFMTGGCASTPILRMSCTIARRCPRTRVARTTTPLPLTRVAH